MGNITTWREFIELIANDEVVIINMEKRYWIDTKERYSLINMKKDIMDEPIDKNANKKIKGILWLYQDDLVVVLDDNEKPTVVINENAIFNPFIFEDTVIAPGHDAIICYNRITKFWSRNLIR